MGLLELEKINGDSMENFCMRKAHTDSLGLQLQKEMM